MEQKDKDMIDTILPGAVMSLLVIIAGGGIVVLTVVALFVVAVFLGAQ